MPKTSHTFQFTFDHSLLTCLKNVSYKVPLSANVKQGTARPHSKDLISYFDYYLFEISSAFQKFDGKSLEESIRC